MTTQQQAYALFLSDELLKGMWAPNVLQNESALRARAAQDLRRQHAEIETLRAGYDAARLEIASLRERVQQLGQLARDVNSRRVVELEAQLAAVGAGGVGTLMLAPAQDDSLTAAYMAGAHDAAKAARKRLDGKP